MKKVSVIIPAYNKAELTVKTVESVLGQTYNNIEIVVVDDGSTDDTRQSLLPYSHKIKYIYKENGGACRARNMGIRSATGEYVALLDCDDIYLPKKIEKCVDYLERKLDIGFVYTPACFIDANGARIKRYPRFARRSSGYIARKLLRKNFICNSTVVVRRGCFKKAGYFDESIFTSADWDMWLRLSEYYKAGYIDEPLTLYRSSDSYILNNLERTKKECFVVLEKAFKRNNILRKNVFLSNVYFQQALGYLRIGDVARAKREIILALKENTFSLQAWVLLMLVILLRGKLVLILKYLRIL